MIYTLAHLTLEELDAAKRQPPWQARFDELRAKGIASDEEAAERDQLLELAQALDLERRRRMPSRWLGGLVQRPTPLRWIPSSLRPPILADRLERNSPEAPAAIVTFRPDPRKGELFDDALREARWEAADRPELVEVGIRRSDRPGHPWVCTWKRRSRNDSWAFSWGPGWDSPTDPPIRLTENGPGITGREALELEKALNRFDANDVFRSLHGIHEHPLRGKIPSEEALTGKAYLGAPAGVTIRKDWAGKDRFRVTIVGQGGGHFDELVLPTGSLSGLGAALLERLGGRGDGAFVYNGSAPGPFVYDGVTGSPNDRMFAFDGSAHFDGPTEKK